MKTQMLAILLASMLSMYGVALAGNDSRCCDEERWGQEEWKEAFWDGPCEVKIESKRGEYKREINCKDGVGAWWDGEWKKEFRDGSCRVKQEAKHDEFKEEVKCDRGASR